MIALLRGQLAASALGEVVVDVGGVGYRVHVPPGAVRAGVGDEVTLHTHLAVREDALTLYGFTDAAARDLYEVLLGVGGVGPKLALAAIGTLGPDGLRAAVLAGDVSALTVVPGIGRKGAQRMILELAEKVGDDLGAGAAATGPEDADARAEVRQALSSLGYAAAEIRAALDAPGVADGADEPEELLRAALRQLGGRAGGR